MAHRNVKFNESDVEKVSFEYKSNSRLTMIKIHHDETL